LRSEPLRGASTRQGGTLDRHEHDVAITGNIAVTANSIRFGNGAVVGLKPTGTPDVFTLDP